LISILKDVKARIGKRALGLVKYVVLPSLLVLSFVRNANAAVVGLQIISQLDSIKAVLSQVGPILSAVLFVIAGVFYALGQIMPPDKRANFHTTAINIIIGAIFIGIMSVASTSLALASSHLLQNVTAGTNSIS
jgi:hypothetical protein